MKKKWYRIVATVIIASLTLFQAPAIPAHAAILDTAGYSALPVSTLVNPDWMKDLPDTMPLSKISIPGTHETLATNCALPGFAAWTICQSKSLPAQLATGIRAFDVRCMYVSGVPDKLFITHGPINQWMSFDQVVADCIAFLSLYPSETILMRLKLEEPNPLANYIGPQDETTFASYFSKYYFNSLTTDYFWHPAVVSGAAVTMPNLGPARGKIVILRDFGLGDFQPQSEMGIVYDKGTNGQDKYEPSSLYSKWEDVKKCMIDTNKMNFVSGSALNFNYLSANGILKFYDWPPQFPPLTPYFVASGNFLPGTYAANLCTFKSANSSTWPDFPRQDVTIRSLAREIAAIGYSEAEKSGGDLFYRTINKIDDVLDDTINRLPFVDISVRELLDHLSKWSKYLPDVKIGRAIYYEGTNELTLKYLKSHSEIRRVGVVMMDFPGAGLIQSIINLNFPGKNRPVVMPISPAAIYSGEMITVNARYTDVDIGEKHSATIDWGDGRVYGTSDYTPEDTTDNLVGLTEPAGDIKGTVTGSAVYYRPGTYLVIVEVTDENWAAGQTTFTVDVLPIPVDMKVRNTINLGSEGLVQVTLYSEEDFDVTKIDLTTVHFGPNEASVQKSKTEDANGDGRMDLVLHFLVADSEFTATDTSAVMTGETTEGLYFQSIGAVKVVVPNKK